MVKQTSKTTQPHAAARQKAVPAPRAVRGRVRAADTPALPFDDQEQKAPPPPHDKTPVGGNGKNKAKAAKKGKKRRYATAEQMAGKQRDISVSEFFAKNRHLLGFDNPRKALLTTIKEAVDNSLDACEEAGILPTIDVVIRQRPKTDDRFVITITDNGPGIVKNQIPSIFGRLLYGSKFHQLKQSRGQQGIGISAAGMYGLLTTGRSVQITSRTNPKRPAHYYELQIDTKKNRPEIIKDEEIEWDQPVGTSVSIELTGRYNRGKQSVDEYLEQSAISNPHATFRYCAPDGSISEYPGVTNELPREGKAIKPHPYGIELGVLIKMLKETDKRTLQAFLTSEFSRVSNRIAQEIADRSKVLTIKSNPTRVGRQGAETLHQAINATKIMAPGTGCIVPIGAEALEAGLRKVIDADFYAVCSRPPNVYRGNPFCIEAGIAYGGKANKASGSDEPGLIRMLRFANRVPLLYQKSAGSMYKGAVQTNWRNYGLSQSRGALPSGPVVLMIHIASVWVPFTSESKEAVAHYPEIIKEIKLALQEVGRKLGTHIRRQKRIHAELKKRGYIESYIPHIGEALQEILGFSDTQREQVNENLKVVLEKTRMRV